MPGNRPPFLLEREISLLDPAVVLVVGRGNARGGAGESITSTLGRERRADGPSFVTASRFTERGAGPVLFGDHPSRPANGRRTYPSPVCFVVEGGPDPLSA